jgi:uncharacterized protein (DUF302 family)
MDMGNKIISVFHWSLLTLILLLSASAKADTPSIVTHKIDGKFHEVLNNVRAAIIGKGIHIAHVLPASSMLNRTGSAFGYKENVYSNAQTLEFCSADISHKLARQDPDNIVLCPFTISVYSLVKEPGVVRLSYRIPVGKPGSEKVIREILGLIDSIIEDAEW